jgi:hypothetical protein
MAQINQDVTIYAGNDVSLRFENIYKEDTGGGILITDILGAEWAITPFEDEVIPILSKSLALGQITLPVNGTVVVAITASDTIGISGEFSHELRLLGVNGVQTASRGKLTIRYKISPNPS